MKRLEKDQPNITTTSKIGQPKSASVSYMFFL